MTTNEKEFLKCVEKHELKILRDDGVYRHVRLKAPGPINCYQFDLVTWPNFICFDGDGGPFIFANPSLEDMFTNFRGAEFKPVSFFNYLVADNEPKCQQNLFSDEFVWACRAIVWGIQKYDEAKAAGGAQ